MWDESSKVQAHDDNIVVSAYWFTQVDISSLNQFSPIIRVNTKPKKL